LVPPRRNRVAAISGADVGVETIPSNAFRPLTPVYPYPCYVDIDDTIKATHALT